MRIIFRYLIFLVTISSCNKTYKENTEWFQIEIVAQKNIDCQIPEITFNTNQTEAFQIIGNSTNRYVAIGLPKANYPIGTKLNVSIRQPTTSESVACTTLGPSWPQVFIDKIQ